MSKPLECLRCGQKMNYIRTEKLQLGQTSWLWGDLPNLLSGAMEVDVYACTGCGKVEFFFAAGGTSNEENLPQKQCPRCGKWHDFDYPKCPFCKYDYNT